MYYAETQELYRFLFGNDFPAYICNAARKMENKSATIIDIENLVLQLHTGESLVDATPGWDWESREKLGQQHLLELARTILNDEKKEWDGRPRFRSKDALLARLELDGYVYRDNSLYPADDDVLNVEEEKTVLAFLYSKLGLLEKDKAFSFFDDSEARYSSGFWSDAITNSRRFFEFVLSQCAAKYSLEKCGSSLDERVLSRPVEVRAFLEKNGLIEAKECEAIAKTYGLLSHTGAHPYMAEKDQARLLRQLVMTLTQFILLRLEGASK